MTWLPWKPTVIQGSHRTRRLGRNGKVASRSFIYLFFWWSTITNYWKHFPQSICGEFISPMGYFFPSMLMFSIYIFLTERSQQYCLYQFPLPPLPWKINGRSLHNVRRKPNITGMRESVMCGRAGVLLCDLPYFSTYSCGFLLTYKSDYFYVCKNISVFFLNHISGWMDVSLYSHNGSDVVHRRVIHINGE